MKQLALSLILGAAVFMAPASLKAATFVDVIVVVDESGSMGTEHGWLGGMATALNTKLVNLGYTPNFGLFGFGGGGAGNLGRTLLNGGTAAQFSTATGNLVVTGSTEDGYAGLSFASTTFAFSGGVRNYILVTDEDRDNASAHTFASTAAMLSRQSALLNAVVNNPFTCTGGTAADTIGRTTLSGYRANGVGGYTTCAAPVTGDGANATETDYVPLALGSGGAAWNLNLLRAGGNSAASFTAAFVDIKVQEIITQNPIPEPATFLVGGSALIGLALLRRRKS